MTDERDEGMNEAFRKKLHNNTQFTAQNRCFTTEGSTQDSAAMKMHRFGNTHVILLFRALEWSSV